MTKRKLLLGLVLALVVAWPASALAQSVPRPTGTYAPSASAKTVSAASIGMLSTWRRNAEASVGLDSADKTTSGAAFAAEAGDVTVSNGGTYYWSGEWLHIDGYVRNDSTEPLIFLQAQVVVKTLGGSVVDDSIIYPDTYQLNPSGWASFKQMIYLPDIAGTDVDVTVDAWGVPAVPPEPVALTEVSRSMAVEDGLRIYTVTFSNDSAEAVVMPIVGGWEFDSEGYIIDSLFSYDEVEIAPGEQWTTEVIGFNAYATPTDVQIYCEALPASAWGEPTSLTFSAPSTSEYASAKVSGLLTDEFGNPLSNREVEIGYSVGTSGDWYYAATVTTDENGKFSRTMKPKSATTYEAYFGGDETYAPQVSAQRKVLPKARLTRSTAWSTLYRNKPYYAKGYIEPYHKTSNSNKVTIRAYKKGSDNKYHYVKSFPASYVYSSSSKTGYKAAIKFTSASSKGTWKFVAYHATDTNNYKTYGSPDYVTLK